MAKLGHGPSLDLTDALTGECEVFTDFFQGAWLATIKSKAEFEYLTFALVKGGQ